MIQAGARAAIMLQSSAGHIGKLANYADFSAERRLLSRAATRQNMPELG